MNRADPNWALPPACLRKLRELAIYRHLGGANLGNNWEGVLPQVGNSFQWTDNLTWVKGDHTIKFGVDIRRGRFDQTYYFDVNGEYTFDNSGPNAHCAQRWRNYAEYLLGLADDYVQGFGPARRRPHHFGLSVRAGQLEDQAEPDSELRPALGAEYAAHRHQRHVRPSGPGQNSTVYPCSAR